MTELFNSRREIRQATYARLSLNDDSIKPERGLEKHSFLMALDPTSNELNEVTKSLAEKTKSNKGSVTKDIKIIRSSYLVESQEYFRRVNNIGRIDAENLIIIAKKLVDLRRKSYSDLLKKLKSDDEMKKTKGGEEIQKKPKPSENKISEPIGEWEQIDYDDLPSGASAYKLISLQPISAKRTSTKPNEKKLDEPKLAQVTFGEKMVFPKKVGIQPTLDHDIDTLTIKKVNGRYVTNKGMELPSELSSMISHLTARDEISITEMESEIEDGLGSESALIEDFIKQLKVSPVGILHLERLNFIPAGIERGELAHSLPLAPGEEVSVSHKEWSNTSEEFEKIVTDFYEDYSEKGVVENSEIAESTNSEEEHSMGLNTAITASGEYGSVKVSASAALNIAQSESNSQEFSRSKSKSITSKASSRVAKEHKISFRVISARGIEDMSASVIRNPFNNRAVRVDYYQLVRKWKINLYRYGLRLTYDIVIPEPSIDILAKFAELQRIRNGLEGDFEFSLRPEDIGPANYETLAAEYSVHSLQAPPETIKYLTVSAQHQWTNYSDAKKGIASAVELDTGDDYYLSGIWGGIFATHFIDEPKSAITEFFYEGYLTRSGKIWIPYRIYYASSAQVILHATITLKQRAMDAWRLKTWNIIHEAAYNSFLERRSFLRDKASELEEELASQDSLSLRKMEREEIMKVVLRWLFGPMFKFNPDTSTDPSYNTSDDLKTDHMWKHTLYYGELIKFLHQAIEWENMLYFLYPYFWSHRSRWELKKGLDHPDAIHKAFLKSGAARVVLPVRPGFEKDFVSFVETGTFNPLLKGHPYLTIAEEIENYAKTEYPGMPSANPIEDARPLLHPKQKKAWEDMQKIMQLIELYRSGNSGKYPSQLSDLASFGSIQSKDPWGNDYVYIYPGEHSTYDLFSRGKNGILGGTEEDEDITNWATASLIAIWYEYTPTGAVDIEFDTGDVPNA